MFLNRTCLSCLRMLLFQVTILQQLDHPSIVSMVGVALRPRVLVLELAPMGSLGLVFKSRRILPRQMQHRIVLQVTVSHTKFHQIPKQKHRMHPMFNKKPRMM